MLKKLLVQITVWRAEHATYINYIYLREIIFMGANSEQRYKQQQIKFASNKLLFGKKSNSSQEKGNDSGDSGSPHGGIWRTMHCRLCIKCYGTG